MLTGHPERRSCGYFSLVCSSWQRSRDLTLLAVRRISREQVRAPLRIKLGRKSAQRGKATVSCL